MNIDKYNDEEEKAEVSMSPLIDCVFLLLIFFLVATMVKKKDMDISITLPESNSAERRLATDNQAVVGVDPRGNFYLNGAQTTIMEMHSKLRHLAVTNEAIQIRIDADAEAPLASVVEVVDLCQFNNLGDVVLRTYDEYYNRRR